MLISNILTPELIKLDLEALDKEELFGEMVQLFVRAGVIKNRQAALDALSERESKGGTGIGDGIAFPHGKLEELSEPVIAIGVSRDGVDYDSEDCEPVYVAVMVLSSPKTPGMHLEVLTEASRVLSQPGFVDKLKGAKSSLQVLQLIQAEEQF